MFRDIFKNSFLPYRDSETLKLFLKSIGEFEYTHSEKLGDAFEDLLSVMGSQGDAGQFRTPRHIIDFLVAIVNPGKKDKILDPACGTAGFLISAFKHINGQNKKGLTPDERKKLIQNFTGYDISPDMVRLSMVNLYLHGFNDPHIYEYDTLSSEERWDESFDVVLANPPFMSPKGGIRPHKKFSISSNRSEVLFVDYIAEHLNPKGRAGIIVPEGVIFQSGTAYKELRKMLVENYLYAVVSLPAGVFNPYSGVKTSILLMDAAFAKASNEILFVKIENDGYGLGAQRTPVKGSQLEEAIEQLQQFKEGRFSESKLAHAVPKSELGKNGDYNLSGERYKNNIQRESIYDLHEIGSVCNLVNGTAFKPSDWEPKEKGGLPIIRIQNLNNKEAEFNYYSGEIDKKFIVEPEDLLFSWSGSRGTSFGAHIWYGGRAILNQHIFNVHFDKKKAIKQYMYYVLNQVVEEVEQNLHGGVGLVHITKGNLEKIKIPLPPLSIQQEIVAEIEGWQKIIDGAKAVVENYKPKIDINPNWEMVELGEVADLIGGGTPSRQVEEYWGNGDIDWVSCSDFTSNSMYLPNSIRKITSEGLENSSSNLIEKETLILVTRVSLGKLAFTSRPTAINQDLTALKFTSEKINKFFAYYYLLSLSDKIERDGNGITVKGVNRDYVRALTIPLPPISIQHQIVSQIEKEQALVNANKQLIEIFEQKIKDRIAKVWGENKKEEKLFRENKSITFATQG
ncbi:MAG: N-6 DNA methylase [Bacteroidetes bacterium]|nr:N-6 DNA methylase [Bacteroidota bacterium]